MRQTESCDGAKNEREGGGSLIREKVWFPEYRWRKIVCQCNCTLKKHLHFNHISFKIPDTIIQSLLLKVEVPYLLHQVKSSHTCIRTKIRGLLCVYSTPDIKIL